MMQKIFRYIRAAGMLQEKRRPVWHSVGGISLRGSDGREEERRRRRKNKNKMR